ncbi:MAG: invasion associated locus B family protein [Gammaproteobacteria bacterium]
MRSWLLAYAVGMGGMNSAVFAKPNDGEVHGNWTVRCEKQQGAEQCFIFQNLVLREGGQRVLHIAVGFLAKEADPIALVTLPLGISLPPGVSMVVDQDGPTTKFPIERCEPKGCRGGVKLDAQILDALKKGKEATVTFHDAARQPVKVPISLKGFSAGLIALH